jgi:hypothetical protein
VKTRLPIGIVIDWFCGASTGLSQDHIENTSPEVPEATFTKAPYVVAVPEPEGAVKGPKVNKLLFLIWLIPPVGVVEEDHVAICLLYPAALNSGSSASVGSVGIDAVSAGLAVSSITYVVVGGVQPPREVPVK